MELYGILSYNEITSQFAKKVFYPLFENQRI